MASISNNNIIPSYQTKLNYKYKRFDKEVNTDINFFKIFTKYVNSVSGANKLFKLLKISFKWTVVCAKNLNLSYEFIQKYSLLAKKFGFIANSLILTKFPYSINGAKKAYKDFAKEDGSIETKRKDSLKEYEFVRIRKRDNLIKSISSLFADSGFLIQFFEKVKLFSLNSIVNRLSLGRVVKDLSKANMLFSSLTMIVFQGLCIKEYSENYSAHKEHEEESKKIDNNRFKIIAKENQRLSLIKLAKSIASIASQMLFYSEMGFGVVLVSRTGLLAISTASLALGIWSHFYAKVMTYPRHG